MARKTTSQGRAPRARRRQADRPANAPWGPTELQRDYRTLLDRARTEPQLIRDSDGELLVVEEEHLAAFRRDLVGLLSQVARFQAVFAENQKRAPKEWAHQTDFPFVAALGHAEVVEFAHELLAYTLDAAQRGTLENVRGNLRAWESTTAIYEDPDVLERMTAAIDYGKLSEVLPPAKLSA